MTSKTPEADIPLVATITAARRSFEEDVKPLIFMVAHHKNLILRELEMTLRNREFVEEDKIRTLAGKAARDALGSLTEEYQAILHMYYTPESLSDYITSCMLIPLVDRSLLVNRAVVSGKGGPSTEPTINVESTVMSQSKDM